MNDSTRATLNDPNTPVWEMLAVGGIDLDLVNASPDGTWDLISGGIRIAFGEATTETGDAAEGWDWAEYTRIDGEWELGGQDYAATDEAMMSVLAAKSGR